MNQKKKIDVYDMINVSLFMRVSRVNMGRIRPGRLHSLGNSKSTYHHVTPLGKRLELIAPSRNDLVYRFIISLVLMSFQSMK